MKYLRKSLIGKKVCYSKKITDGIILNANESAFSTPRKIIDLVKKELDNLDLRRYPDTDVNFLRERLARAYGIKMQNLICGVGSDQILDCIFRSLIDDEYVIESNPTFSMYKEYISYTNGKLIDIDLTAEFKFDIEKILAAIKNIIPS